VFELLGEIEGEFEAGDNVLKGAKVEGACVSELEGVEIFDALGDLDGTVGLLVGNSGSELTSTQSQKLQSIHSALLSSL